MMERKQRDFATIAKKWQERWEHEKIFQPALLDKPKFFCNFPYPYINAYQHIGHLYTLMRVDAFARYKRLKGFNVLFPQGWHATGSPILNAAQRIKQGEPKQLKIMHDMGFTDDQIKQFEEPEHWVEFFAPEFKKDYQSMGMSIDWSREFHTTSLNPHYDKFIRWQFNKLKEKGYVIQGKFPVVWCPKDNCAVGDHSRAEGEGETAQEVVLTRHRLPTGAFLISVTLRPDTILGITNLYVHPDITYAKARVTTSKGEETWILSTHAIKRLQEQDWTIEQTGEINGRELIGQHTEEFSTEASGNRRIPILPATFLDEEYGSGLVHSVPSDSADDLIALWDLQKDEATIKKFGLDAAEIKALKPIAILDTPGLGPIAAETLLKKNNVTSQNQRGVLEKIKKELYKLSHHHATFNEKYKTGFGQDLTGKKVEEGKDIIKNKLIEEGWAETAYQLTGKVTCRCLTPAIVKIVDNQWFINYKDPAWKQQAHKCLDKMQLFPEKARQQFAYTIDWLREWACTREDGLGTSLPWDEKWLIESLSDSTIYMAYYTIVPLLKQVPIAQVDDKLFDYIFHGKGDKPAVTGVDEMRQQFQYWYPVDFRNSGKDLIQNHLTFFIFNHVALFPEEHWPKGIGTNGWVTVDGQKMSKSLGNMIPVRDMAKQFGPDASRVTILFGGESLDDPNWDTAFAKSVQAKIESVMDFCVEHNGTGAGPQPMDAWFTSKLHYHIKLATECMDATLFRSALQQILFELPRAARHYVNRSGNVNKELLQQYIAAQAVMLGCFAPHNMEELWEELGNKGFISLAEWPTYNQKLIDESLHHAEEQFSNVMSDIKTVLGLAKIDKPKKVTLFLPDAWKYDLVRVVKDALEKSSNPKDVIGAVMAVDALKKQGQQVMKIVPALVKDRSKLPRMLFTPAKEQEQYTAMLPDLEKEFGCSVELVKAGTSDHHKAKQAFPGKPAILVE